MLQQVVQRYTIYEICFSIVTIIEQKFVFYWILLESERGAQRNLATSIIWTPNELISYEFSKLTVSRCTKNQHQAH